MSESQPQPLQLPAGFLTAGAVQCSQHARVLVVGPAKAGKTTSLVATASKALVLNADGESAVKGARRLAPNPTYPLETPVIRTEKQWDAARKGARELVAKGLVETIFLDTITNLADNILDDLMGRFDGYDLWNAYNDNMTGGVKDLFSIPAHVVIISHMDPSEDEMAGIMPMIAAKSKHKIPTLIDDWLLFDYTPQRKPHERMLQFGPQGKWTHHGRNITRTCATEASMPVMLKELGLTPKESAS